MSVKIKFQDFFDTVKNISLRIIRYISSAAIRIFSPSKDDYPATGVQPYEGESADE